MNFQDRIINIILEAHAAYIDTKAKDYDPYAGPIARRYGRKRMSSAPKPKDPVVHKGVSDAVKRLNKKMKGAKTNPQLQHMVQSALLKRRGKKRGLPTERPEDARADAQRDKWRRMAPGDK